MIPYGKQWIDEDDIADVVQVLRSDWLTTGPKVAEFESTVAEGVGAEHAVAISSGTAALHAMMFALDIGPGDEVIVPAMTFAATANCVVYQGGTPVFADVLPDSLLIDPASVEELITPQTKAVIAVDYAGQPCDYQNLQRIADRHGIELLSDGCHSLGARTTDGSVGALAKMTAFSFHPVKAITTGEGGMVTTNDAELASIMRQFRNHGIQTDAQQREKMGTWFYEMSSLGYNYRISDFQCALGIRQYYKLDSWLERRQQIADRYDRAFSDQATISPLKASKEIHHGYHLYVIRVPEAYRDQMIHQLRESGISANVHYIPVHYHPYYRQNFQTGPGMCPASEQAYREIISLPIFPRMTDIELETVIETTTRLIDSCQKSSLKKAS